MLPYIFLIAASLAGGPLLARYPKRRRTFLLLFGLACWLLASLRYVTGFDYRSYETFFQRTADTGLSGLLTLRGQELGYRALNLAVALAGGDYRAFLFVFHLLLTALVFLWIERYSPSAWMSAYLFVTLQYFALSMNLMRQALAAAIFLWTYPHLRGRRLLPFCGIVLLAACFHRSALFMLPFYLLLRLPVSALYYGLALLLTGLAYLFADPLLQFVTGLLHVYQGYPGRIYWQANTWIYLLFPLGCFLFAWPLLRRAARDPAASPVLANSVFCSLLIQLFITRHFILERLSIYAAILSLAALPEAALIPEGKRSSRARTILLAAGGLAYFLFAVQQGFHGVYPYHGVWDRAISP